MDLDWLRVFIEVARRGSFTAVARERDVEPSSISRTVAALEEKLGIRLFERTTRQLALTEAGELYRTRVAPLVEEFERAGEEALAARLGATGTLRLTASVAFGQVKLVPLLPALQAQHPALRVELLLTDANLDLVAERVDLAIRLAPRVEGDFIAARLMSTRYHVCAAPQYLRTRPLLRPGDLPEHGCLLSALPDFRSRWRFRSADGGVEEVPVTGNLITTNAVALRDCALAGMGAALLPDWLIEDELAAGRLIDPFPQLRVTATNFETGAWLVYPSRDWLPAKVRVTIAFLRSELGKT